MNVYLEFQILFIYLYFCPLTISLGSIPNPNHKPPSSPENKTQKNSKILWKGKIKDGLYSLYYIVCVFINPARNHEKKLQFEFNAILVWLTW